ncbi:MAG: hypothetical protein JOZ72_08050 [Alphaproteobacteria bacterium]|nr:hypothetical protein [Alphaproteobacteria bacterium]
MKSFRLAFAAALFALPAVVSSSHAQTERYDVKTMNFDLWCQEQAGLPPDRCDKRLPDDEARFEAYRAKIEKYEVPFLERKDHEQQFDRDVMHADPLDNPIHKNDQQRGETPMPQQDPQ